MKDSNNVAKVLIYKDGKYLVFTRADNKKNDLPGGHVHINEEFMMGAIREVYEESKIILLQCKEIVSYGRKKVFFSKRFDYANTNNEIELDKKENSDYRWVDLREFMRLKISESTDAIVAAQSHLLSFRRKEL